MLIKYMGTSDNRVLEKGEDFGGQLADPLTKRVAWTVANNHLVDSEKVGLSPEACDLLLSLEGVVYGEGNLLAEDEQDQSTAKTIKEFKDVSDVKIIPPSLHQTTFLGLKGVKNKDVADEDAPEPDEDPRGDAEPTEGERKTEAAGKPVKSASARGGGTAGGGTAGGGTAVGGSTDGAGGDTTTTGTT